MVGKPAGALVPGRPGADPPMRGEVPDTKLEDSGEVPSELLPRPWGSQAPVPPPSSSPVGGGCCSRGGGGQGGLLRWTLGGVCPKACSGACEMPDLC